MQENYWGKRRCDDVVDDVICGNSDDDHGIDVSVCGPVEGENADNNVVNTGYNSPGTPTTKPTKTRNTDAKATNRIKSVHYN